MSRLTYVVTSEKARVIDGLGVFLRGETREFPGGIGGANETFRYIKGVNLLPANLPEDVLLTIRIDATTGEED